MTQLDKAAYFQQEAAKNATAARWWQDHAKEMEGRSGRDICLRTATRFQHYSAQDYALARRLGGIDA